MAKEFVSLARLSEVITALKERITNKVSKSGDTMTGDLKVGASIKLQTNGYIIGNWVQMQSDIALNAPSTQVCVLHNKWVYTRTLEQFKSDLGIENSLDVTVEGNQLIFYSGATVAGNQLILGG